ncbi:TonB-dependent receptor [Rhodanobacter sp. L36]|uniref:TonB-dependent receptor domain-containing protein n=1 Tax=Rhodanobacter sp. L36 TaxID=1747221 RepID=UPI0020B11E11|nr:TonB-dependent receptor [Rhodanobacter sp. L36]
MQAQSTTGSIFGNAPVASGESVQITGGSGFNRNIPVDSSGHYSTTLPVGTYTVTLLQNGQAVQTRENVTPKVAGATEVSFISTAGATTANSANAQTLSGVTVSANALPAIDVTSTNESTVITAEQLKHLPLQRSAEAIALLAPGATQGSSTFMMANGKGAGPTGTSLVSFGGSSVAENAYYINGFNTSDPLGNSGGISLPYGSIEQQQTLTSGYGAQYGRSAGGVISQVGKSGTNDWHFGAQVLWQPAFARGNQDNIYYGNPRSTTPDQEKGDLNTYQRGNSQWNTVYDAYVGGPLIKDTLFFFVSAEANKTQNATVQSIDVSKVEYQKSRDPKIYAKLDWNINDSNTLSLTGVKNTDSFDGAFYNYDYNNKKAEDFSSLDLHTKNSFGIWIAKYTGYITDNLTVNAMFGKMEGTYYTVQPPYPGLDTSLAHISGASHQNPAYLAGHPGGITNANVVTAGQVNRPDHKSSVDNLRLDLDWKLGNHDIQFGIDNDLTNDIDAGNTINGPGYAWSYGFSSPNNPIIGGDPNHQPYVAPTEGYPNGATGYWVNKYIFVTQASVQVKQRAQYIQDNWQVTPNLLLNIGIRNDQFTNYNGEHVPYLRLTSPQWSPRIGFSWDVFGDSSMKIFGNAGRYYLAMPAGVALREASGSLYTNQYYTYSGIDSQGIPIGLTPIASNPSGPVSTNNEYGQPLDPATVASKNLKAEYQDEFVLGMQQQINSSWVYGVTLMHRNLGRIIDDVDDEGALCDKLVAGGFDTAECPNHTLNGSILVNPGSSNVIRVANAAGGYDSVTMTPQDYGFPKATRKYYSLEAYLEHPWDGTWTGKIDYVFSRSFGTTEGPVMSSIGQGGNSVSATQQWDFGSLMQYANGDQANEQKHVLKAYGTYQVAPEWTVSGIVILASGVPNVCLGFYGPDETDPAGYATVTPGAYHWCGGQPSAPGKSGFTPWTHTLNLSAEYRPAWADKKLGFQIMVNNVFNEQKATALGSIYGTTAAPSTTYKLPIALEMPRYVQMGITYDF